MKSGIFVPVNAQKSPQFSAVNDNLQAVNVAFVCAENCWKRIMRYVELPEVNGSNLHMNSSEKNTWPENVWAGLNVLTQYWMKPLLINKQNHS